MFLGDKKKVFKGFLPLMGKEYFFPGVPLGGRIKPPFERNVYDSDGEDEDARDQFFASKIDYFSDSFTIGHLPRDIHNSVTKISYSNFDVVSFLSTDKRDYLVRNEGYSNRVKVVSLKDKRWVMICCLLCPIFSNGHQSLQLRAVSNVCSDLYDCYGGSFEMVLVFKMMEDFRVDESAFRHQLSGFPSSCLVVPFWDSHSSDSICHSLEFTGGGKGLFLSVDERKVIWHKHLYSFTSYGLDAFPFGDDDIQRISSNECRRSWKCQSLENLLCCPSFLYKIPGGASGGLETSTSIEQLKETLVGVYLCLNGDLIPKLRQVHECCIANNKAFEIVLVYCPFSVKNSDPELFQTLINRALEKLKISWWVLPFKSWVSLRLLRLCRSHDEDQLIIVGNGFADPCGSYVIQKFGMDSYPFSRNLMIEKETERISEVTLDSLLVYRERDYVLQNEDKVPVASLVGKNIFIYVDKYRHFDARVYDALFSYFVDIKAKGLEFEVVYVGSSAASVCTATETPWLVCPFDVQHLEVLSNEISVRDSTLVAVKKDGRVGSIQALKHVSYYHIRPLQVLKHISSYPFDGSGLKRDVIELFRSRYHDIPLDNL